MNIIVSGELHQSASEFHRTYTGLTPDLHRSYTDVETQNFASLHTQFNAAPSPESPTSRFSESARCASGGRRRDPSVGRCAECG